MATVTVCSFGEPVNDSSCPGSLILVNLTCMMAVVGVVEDTIGWLAR